MDLVTAGDLSPRPAKLEFISIAGDYGQALLAPDLLPELVPLLEAPACKIVGHNLLFALSLIRAVEDRRLRAANLWDTMLAWQILNNGISYRMLSLREVSEEMLDKHPYGNHRTPNLQNEPSSKRLENAARQSMIPEPIYERQKALIEKYGLTKVAELEFSAIPAMVEIENNGIGFNTAKGKVLLGSLSKEEDRLTKEIQLFAESKGLKSFNPRNTLQVRNMLRRLGYRVGNTSASTLQKIAQEHPGDRFTNLLLEYRGVKQQQSLLKSWVSFARDGRIYPHIEQLGARGGRMTCFWPNIHQVPRDPKLKSLFEAAPGMSLVESDFSTIEMRLIAVLSGEKTLLKIFKEGLDPHKQTAQAIFQKKEISEEERQIAKTLNYGTIYGGGANMVLSKLPNLTENEAREFIYRFYDSYPGLRRWQRKVSEGTPVKAIDGEYYRISRSILGRVRFVDPNHRNALINTPVQSSGTDLQKIALGRLYEKLASPKYREFKLVNAVHDSILLEVPERRAVEASKLLQDVMEQAGNEILQVIPCVTDVKIGKDWSFRKDKHRSILGRTFSLGLRIFGRG